MKKFFSQHPVEIARGNDIILVESSSSQEVAIFTNPV
jgi:hypothetical protein